MNRTYSSRGRDRRSSSPQGFTLLELAVVFFIMGLLLTLVTPYIGTFRTSLLKQEVRRLAGRANFLYDKASADKLVMKLTFDIEDNRYSVSQLDPYSAQRMFVPDMERGAEPVQLPPSVRLRDVTVEGIGTLGKGAISALFYPEGYVDMTIIHLQDDLGHVFTVKLVPLTGRVIVRNGDLSPTVAAALVR